MSEDQSPKIDDTSFDLLGGSMLKILDTRKSIYSRFKLILYFRRFILYLHFNLFRQPSS